jgi:sulfate adenylyltransferase (ADP) / ATP adenylyltransferase
MSSPSLYERSLKVFDELNAAGELLYNPSEPEHISRDGFLVSFTCSFAHLTEADVNCPQFRFRQSKALTTKPLTAIHNPKISPNPFLPPEPSFVISYPDDSHTMILNKFCPLRPMLLIHTNEFESQDNDLTLSDITALWNSLLELSDGLDKLNVQHKEEKMEGGEKELMATYGCGADAGASQGHKHCQIFPKDGPLWPDKILEEIPTFRKSSFLTPHRR